MGINERLNEMVNLMLIPLRLIGKALLYLLSAIIGAAGFILLIISTIAQRIGFLAGGASMLCGIIMLIFLEDKKTAGVVMLMGAAAVLVPIILTFISGGIVALKEKLLDVSADIDIF